MPSSKNQDYVVEKIVSKRTNGKGQVFYLIKWKGYSSADNTWEPESNVNNCPDLVKEFEAEQANTSENRTSARSTRSSLPVSTKLNNEDTDSSEDISKRSSRKRLPSVNSDTSENEDENDHDFVTRAIIKSRASSKRLRNSPPKSKNTKVSIYKTDNDMLDLVKIDEILDVRRNKKNNTIEYHIQVKQKDKKSIWVDSNRIKNDYAQEVIDFLEEKYV
ncbi:hypothetical protein I4U23_030671 [Adineta vaga]|nr:hypothetical protein I4U23_030671 [Adineta vaga]